MPLGMSFDDYYNSKWKRQSEIDEKLIHNWRDCHPVIGRKMNLEKNSDREELMVVIKRLKPTLITMECKPHDSEDVCSFISSVCNEQKTQGRSFGLEGGLHLRCWRNFGFEKVYVKRRSS